MHRDNGARTEEFRGPVRDDPSIVTPGNRGTGPIGREPSAIPSVPESPRRRRRATEFQLGLKFNIAGRGLFDLRPAANMVF
jgi:hypothetical protein